MARQQRVQRKKQYNVRNEAGHLWQVTAQGARSALVAFTAKFRDKYRRWPPHGYQISVWVRGTPESYSEFKYVTAAAIDQAAKLLASDRDY